MSQNYVYPSSSNVTLTGTPNGAPIPSTSILVAGENPSGNQAPLQVDSGGALITSSAAPAPGSATSANQVLEIAQLTNIDTATTALNVRSPGALVPVAYNEIDLTYITSGNGTGSIGTAVYKLAGSTVKTLTLTYDASNRLSTVVAS